MEQKTKKRLGILGVILLVVVVALLYYFLFLLPSLKFQEQESLLEKAGKKYFAQNTYLLPKEGKIREVRLSLLYEKKYIDSIYAPNTNKLCSGKNSFVKVKNTKGKYEYYTYLECGSYQSSTDHEGPVITLNGKDSITIARTKTYQEEGVKSVRDNQDGLLDVKEVQVDASQVDTTKAGVYEVVYTASDSLDNKTVKVRKVKVVEKLATTIENATDKKGYYQGNEGNNYLLLNAMLFRIVGVDEDGNITIVSDETLANVDYSLKNRKVSGSAIDKWLNEYFYNKLSTKAKALLVTNGNWCTDTLGKDALSTTKCSKYTKMKAGLISVQDYNKSLKDGTSYLSTNDIVQWMMNPSSEKGKIWTERSNYYYDENTYFKDYDEDILFGVRPGLKLKKTVEVVGGDGSYSNPFLLGDYEKARVQTKLNTRLSGEFVSYSGYLFRIVDIDQDGNTHVISDGVLRSNGTVITINYPNIEKAAIYNPTENQNLGYLISNEMTQYIKTGSFVKKKITVPIYKDRALYQQEVKTKTYEVKIAAPNTFDLFSARRSNSGLEGYWYLNSSQTKYRRYKASSSGTIYYTNVIDNSATGVKISAYLNKNLKITGGSGTAEDPYKIK